MENPQLILEQALTLHREGKAAEARALYEQILAHDPAHAKALLNLASLDLDAGDLLMTIGRCRDVLAQGVDDPAAELLLARALFLDGEHDEGYEHMARAFSLAPADPGIAYEFMAALRRRYWTYRGDEYTELLELAQASALPLAKLPRLVHQSLARVIRPDYIKIFTRGAQEGEPDIPVIDTWMGKLPESAAGELEVLARNFLAAVQNMHAQPEYRGQPVRVGLRDGSEHSFAELADLDPLTLGSFEFLNESGELSFISMSEVSLARFGVPGAALDVELTLRDGRVLDGFIPLFYALTEFSQNEGVRDGRTTLLRTVVEGVRVPIGLRQWDADGRMLNAVSVSWMEFGDAGE